MKNLSSVNGTISHAILENNEKFTSMLSNDKIDVNDCKSVIITMLRNRTTPCKSRDLILDRMSKCKTKKDLYSYLWNLVLAGDNLAVIYAS